MKGTQSRRLSADGLGGDLLGSAVLDVVHQVLSNVHELVHVVLLGASNASVNIVLRVSDDSADALGILPARAHNTKQTEALLLALLLGEETESSLAVGRSRGSGGARAGGGQTSGGDGSQGSGLRSGRSRGGRSLGLRAGSRSGSRSRGGGRRRSDNGVALGDGGVDLVNTVDVLGLGAGQTLLGPLETVKELTLAGLEALAGVEADGQLEALLGAEEVLKQSQRSLASSGGGRGGSAGRRLDLGRDRDGVETGGREEQAKVGNSGSGKGGDGENRSKLHCCGSECGLFLTN